jgi:hypothetical protein
MSSRTTLGVFVDEDEIDDGDNAEAALFPFEVLQPKSINGAFGTSAEPLLTATSVDLGHPSCREPFVAVGLPAPLRSG